MVKSIRKYLCLFLFLVLSKTVYMIYEDRIDFKFSYEGFEKSIDTFLLKTSWLYPVKDEYIRLKRKFLKPLELVIEVDDRYLFHVFDLFVPPVNQFSPDYKRLIARLNQVESLARKYGMSLYIVPVPSKAFILSDLVYGTHYEYYLKEKFFARFFNDLVENKIAYVDLRSRFLDFSIDERKKLYFRADFHWSYLGSKLAMESVAQRIPSAGRNKDIYNLVWKKTETANIGKHHFYLRLLNYEQSPNIYNEIIQKPQFIQQKFLESDTLFVSASFGHQNVKEFLSNAIGGEVEGFVRPGLGPIYGINEVLKRISSGDQRVENKKNIVWIFPEHHLKCLAVCEEDITIPSPGENFDSPSLRLIAIKNLKEYRDYLLFEGKKGSIELSIPTEQNNIKLDLEVNGIGHQQVIAKFTNEHEEFQTEILNDHLKPFPIYLKFTNPTKKIKIDLIRRKSDGRSIQVKFLNFSLIEM